MARVNQLYRASAIAQSGGCVDAREFYDYLLNRINVKFCPKITTKDTEDDSFEIALSKKMTYDQVSAKVGEHLKVNPTHIRFSTVNSTSGKPKAIVKRNNNQTLSQILAPAYTTYGANVQVPNALFYEVLDLSLSELETKKNLKITWVSEGVTKEVSELQDFCVEQEGPLTVLRRPLIFSWRRTASWRTCYRCCKKERVLMMRQSEILAFTRRMGARYTRNSATTTAWPVSMNLLPCMPKGYRKRSKKPKTVIGLSLLSTSTRSPTSPTVCPSNSW